MQLASIGKSRLIPLVVAGSVASSYAFKYNDVEHSKSDFKIVNSSTANFMQNADSSYYSDLSIRSVFYDRLEQWKLNTMFLSFADQIVSDKNFQEIVSMGERVVPYIIDEISVEPSPLVWSLNFIFNRTISNNPNTTIEQACKLWIKEMS